MKIFEINGKPPAFDELEKAARREDIVVVRNGHALVRVEKFTDEDLEDWKFEHSPEAIEIGRQAREQHARGECHTLEEVMAELLPKKPRRKKVARRKH